MEAKEQKRQMIRKMVQVTRLVNYFIAHEFEKAGYPFSREQLDILELLWEKDGRTQQEFADRLHKNRASITSLIDNMEKHNVVVRIPNPHDKRSKLIYLTQRGKEVQKPLMESSYEAVKIITSDLGEKQLNELDASVSLILDNLIDYTHDKQIIDKKVEMKNMNT